MLKVRKGFIFIISLLKFVIKHPKLLKPSFKTILLGLIWAILFLIPILILVAFRTMDFVNYLLIGFISSMLLFLFFIWTEVMSVRTIQELRRIEMDKTSEGDNENTDLSMVSNAIIKKTLTTPFTFLYKILRSNKAADTVGKSTNKYKWLNNDYLFMPVVSLEEADYRGAIKRIVEMADKRVIQLKPDFAAVRAITWVLTLFFLISGIGVGLWIGIGMTSSPFVSQGQILLGTGIGFVSAALIILFAVVLSAFVRNSYMTSIYMYAKSVEDVRATGNGASIEIPTLLKKNLTS